MDGPCALLTGSLLREATQATRPDVCWPVPPTPAPAAAAVFDAPAAAGAGDVSSTGGHVVAPEHAAAELAG